MISAAIAVQNAPGLSMPPLIAANLVEACIPAQQYRWAAAVRRSFPLQHRRELQQAPMQRRYHQSWLAADCTMQARQTPSAHQSISSPCPPLGKRSMRFGVFIVVVVIAG
jgi:hypothetical protein